MPMSGSTSSSTHSPPASSGEGAATTAISCHQVGISNGSRHSNYEISVFEIPELLLPIGSLLTPHDLVQCILVSHRFYSLFISLLYSSIHILSPLQFHRFLQPTCQAAFTRYSSHLRTFTTGYYGALRCLLPDAVDCRHLTQLEFPRTCRFTNPEIPRTFYETSCTTTATLTTLSLSSPRQQQTLSPPPPPAQLPCEKISLSQESTTPEETTATTTTVNYGYGREDLVMMYECNVETRARNASGLFDEGLLLAVLGKCLRLTVFSMVGFPFEHDEMLKRIGDRLAMTGVASRAAAAAAAAIGDETHVLNSHLSLSSTRPFLSSGIIKDPSLSASSTSSSISLIAPAVSAPTGLKRLELVNQHYCQVKAKSIEYLLNHCTADLEELLLSISFGSRAEVGSTTGHEADQLQGHEQGQEQDMEGMEQENSGSYQSHVDSSWIGHAKHKADETENDREWNMRRLVIKGDLSGSGPLIWLPLLRRCRRLKEIAVDLFTDMSLHQLACTLSQYCPEITEITLRCMTGGPQEDERIADLIRSSRSWKKLSMSYFHGLGSLSTAALIRHSATLETLALEECDGLTSEDIQAVLSSCPNLRIFKALTSNGKDFSTTVYLDANEMVDSPWACNRLECLKLIITGIARPDLQIDQYGQPLTGPLHDGTITGDEMHRIVYSQLGKLTRLRELWLGHDKQDLDDEDNYHSTDVEGQWQFIDPDEQFECLQFSIKSGMELLRGLKELRVLNLDRMKTRIGLSEVQWMVKHWPKLEKVIGLVIQGERVPKHVQWLYDHRPDIELPPVMGNFITAF